MTSNQLAYNRLLEDQRSHLANEEIQRSTLAESVRHNTATENFQNASLLETTRHNFETERISDADSQRRYNASIYAADSSRQASMYAANTAASATRYAAQQAAAASRYVADTNASTQRYVADSNKAASTLKTNVEAQMRLSQIRSNEKIAQLNADAAKARAQMGSDAQLMSSILTGAFTLGGSLAKMALK